MISFLIPIFNQDVNNFVNALYDQSIKADIEFEILLYDDASKMEYVELNRALGQKVGISFMQLSKNLGRSKIRNWLGKNARFEWLVFMDGDSMIESDNFVKSYLDQIYKADVIYGGTSYQKKKPATSKRLHWKYGKNVESLAAFKRAHNPFETFRSNNFMIKRSVFLQYQFDEKIQGYGYEDNRLSQKMKDNHINLVHIDNPLIHDGLEETSIFLKKTENALGNLATLYQDGALQTHLTRTYDKLKDYGLLGLFNGVAESKVLNIRKRLAKKNPNLLLFQLFKLNCFTKLVEEK